MLGAANLRASSNPAIDPNSSKYSLLGRLDCSLRHPPYDLRLPLRFRRLAVQSEYASSLEPSVSSHYTSSVGSSSYSSSLQLSSWNLTHRHILVLNVIACAAAVSATWLFFSAIPTLLAFKRAAESLEKLMDVTREELPETMAAVRLSGMEISDLTMELSDLGQEITQGVRSSTRAVRLAEERLRRLTNMAPPASVQVVTSQKTDAGEPVVARTARSVREGIVKGRRILQVFFTLTQFSRMALNYFAKRAKK
ncbi:Transmembrane protein [Melia azedarach]|uniref:Transmembrane protein n=1 Tax=Melia azedarach TaxID=155640 RepID=A0ACC1XVU8_MELAZ|nr:Transmembrane protein [Melia azedarach]